MVDLPSPVRTDRPWGYFERFTINQKSTVKIIRINPDAMLSLQYHKNRSEYWRVLDGDATAILDGKSTRMVPGDDLFVREGAVHRLVGGHGGARILEIAFGDFSEEDIVRLEDEWKRK